MDSKEATSKAAATEKSGGRLHSFMVRAGAGIVYAALFIGSLLFGVVPTAVFASVMSVLCCYEFYRMMRLDGKVPNEFVGLVASVLFPLSVLVDPVWLTVINFLLVLLVGLWYVQNPPHAHRRCGGDGLRRHLHWLHAIRHRFASRGHSRLGGRAVVHRRLRFPVALGFVCLHGR